MSTPPPAHTLSAKSDHTPWGAVRITAVSEHALSEESRRDLLQKIGESIRASEGKSFDAMGFAVQAALSGLPGRHFTSITIERTMITRGSTTP